MPFSAKHAATVMRPLPGQLICLNGICPQRCFDPMLDSPQPIGEAKARDRFAYSH
jgi:hypothetical protein